MDANEVRAVSILAEGLIKKKSRIDIFSGGRFWAAVVREASDSSFEFRYINSDETGFVRRVDFLKTWRFSFNNPRDVAVGRFMALIA